MRDSARFENSALCRVSWSIWNEAVARVSPGALIPAQFDVSDGQLSGFGHHVDLSQFDRIAVVGGGKAVAQMVVAIERLFEASRKEVFGNVVVPAGSLLPTRHVELVVGRSTVENRPTDAAVTATAEILGLVSGLSDRDLCLAVISGGGSSLLTAPRPPVTLEQKVQLTNQLMDAAATIHEVNRVRGCISQVKHGRLALACRAKLLWGLILSDVSGDDPLAVASGPTVQPRQSLAGDALRVLRKYLSEADIPSQVLQMLTELADQDVSTPPCRVLNSVLASNSTAVEAAANAAEQSGFDVEMIRLPAGQTTAQVADRIVGELTRSRIPAGGRCLILGGEPVLALAEASTRGRGGRNQQLILEIAWRLKPGRSAEAMEHDLPDSRQFCVIAAGTDGEDGPTDAAGAVLDAPALAALDLDSIRHHATRNDAYPLLEHHGLLLKTGMTGTNVCDLVIVTISVE